MFLGEDDERQYLYPPEFHRGFFRLAVGLEDTDDLIRDIDHALVEAGFEVCDRTARMISASSALLPPSVSHKMAR